MTVIYLTIKTVNGSETHKSVEAFAGECDAADIWVHDKVVSYGKRDKSRTMIKLLVMSDMASVQPANVHYSKIYSETFIRTDF